MSDDRLTGEDIRELWLIWRGIYTRDGDVVCSKCGGGGVRSYPDATTWRSGIGGQVVTEGICDGCWGSGCANRKWLNLKTAWATAQELKRRMKKEASDEPED